MRDVALDAVFVIAWVAITIPQQDPTQL